MIKRRDVSSPSGPKAVGWFWLGYRLVRPAYLSPSQHVNPFYEIGYHDWYTDKRSTFEARVKAIKLIPYSGRPM